jgi:hypothetical protein
MAAARRAGVNLQAPRDRGGKPAVEIESHGEEIEFLGQVRMHLNASDGFN